MHGWGGENLDQSLRAWLCGGEIVRAQTSRIAHMWRTADPRTRSKSMLQVPYTNNGGRVAAAWLDEFLPIYNGEAVSRESVQNFESVKRRLFCKPFSYFLYRFRGLYVGGAVIPQKVFLLKERKTGLCLTRAFQGTVGATCSQQSPMQQFQQGNIDRKSLRVGVDSCCSGLRLFKSNDCLDFF